MPFLKTRKPARQLWKDWDEKANKSGLLHTVYFSSGDEYTGEWLDNKKHGKGTYVWKNKSVYNGDWKNDMMDGFGTLSMKHDESDLLTKKYAGELKENKKHGHGVYMYGKNSFYEGEWLCDKRHGWGRMVYEDQSVYEGEWEKDKRSGQGILKCKNENRYEGAWSNDMKNGFGKFYFVDRAQIYEGLWVDDVAKCGEIAEFEKEFASRQPTLSLPKIELLNSSSVLQRAFKDLMLPTLQRSVK